MTIEDIIRYHETKAKELVEGFEALGHAQAARLLRENYPTWRTVLPAKARRLTIVEAEQLGLLAYDRAEAADSVSSDGHAIYAEAMRLAGIEVEGE